MPTLHLRAGGVLNVPQALPIRRQELEGIVLGAEEVLPLVLYLCNFVQTLVDGGLYLRLVFGEARAQRLKITELSNGRGDASAQANGLHFLGGFERELRLVGVLQVCLHRVLIILKELRVPQSHLAYRQPLRRRRKLLKLQILFPEQVYLLAVLLLHLFDFVFHLSQVLKVLLE